MFVATIYNRENSEISFLSAAMAFACLVFSLGCGRLKRAKLFFEISSWMEYSLFKIYDS